MNPLFILVPLAVLATFVALLLWRAAWAPRWPRPARWTIAVLVVGLTLLAVASLARDDLFGLAEPVARALRWVGMTWLAFALYLLIALGAVLVVALGAWLGGRARSRALRVRINRVGTLLAVLVALVTTGYGLWRASHPVLAAYSFSSPALPTSFDGLRVAVVTDLHAGPIRSAALTQEVVDKVNAAGPDLVLLGGDIIDGPSRLYADQVEPFSGLRPPLGVYAVTGNHEVFSEDIAGWFQVWRGHGIEPLSNASVTLHRGADTIALAGVNDTIGAGAYAPDPEAALRGVDPGAFTLYLAHEPRQAEQVAGRGVDLQLSGHTHGGQLWPFRDLVLLQQPMIDGYAVLGDVPTLTSRGAGTWGPPVRVGAGPQILLVTLRAG